MKSIRITFALVTFASIAGFSANVLGAKCYDAGGTVETENVSPTTQVGSMHLTLVPSGSSGIALDETGSLIGNVTGFDGVGATFLSHAATLTRGRFVTTDDRAVVTGVRWYDENNTPLLDEDGAPCSFLIYQTVTEISQADGFFKKFSGNASEVNIVADGYVSNCPTENRNFFELSGTLCKK